ncbi:MULTISPECIES: HAD family hydrolase [Chitinophagaceae]
MSFTDNVHIVLWDFDGVIMDSNSIRSHGFEYVLDGYPINEVRQLLKFHHENGGLSRYVKFRYFFEEIRNEHLSEGQLAGLCSEFSKIMLEKLIDKNLLIKETVDFIQNNYSRYKMHVVSGSDEQELKIICQQLHLDRYFKSIHGSPVPKKELVRDLMKRYPEERLNTVLVGDSINDYEAAKENNLRFYGYNNPSLKNLDHYIEKFS